MNDFLIVNSKYRANKKWPSVYDFKKAVFFFVSLYKYLTLKA